jgi:hypothetical protein
MPHVIEPLQNISCQAAIQSLQAARLFILDRVRAAIDIAEIDIARWGIEMKRITVDLCGDQRPALIGKPNEKFSELINIVATTERLLAAIAWFCNESPGSTIQACHPSTSDDAAHNDLVLADATGQVTVRCEVCDVVSRKASTNGKEKKDLMNLGCINEVPQDGTRRYICTSPEFASALTSLKRWRTPRFYRYEEMRVGDATDSRLLFICPNNG